MKNLKEFEKYCIILNIILGIEEKCIASDNDLYDEFKIFYNMFCNEDNFYI